MPGRSDGDRWTAPVPEAAEIIGEALAADPEAARVLLELDAIDCMELAWSGDQAGVLRAFAGYDRPAELFLSVCYYAAAGAELEARARGEHVGELLARVRRARAGGDP